MPRTQPADKAALSPDRRSRYRETPDIASAAVRLVGAIGRRIADGDPEDLTELARVEHAVAEAFRTGVAGLREAGRSDSEIGSVLGTTKQAVAQRWPRNRP